MIDINKQYTTLDGRPVILLTTEARGDYPVLGYIGDSSLTCWIKDGRRWKDNTCPTKDDLVEVVPETVSYHAAIIVGSGCADKETATIAARLHKGGIVLKITRKGDEIVDVGLVK